MASASSCVPALLALTAAIADSRGAHGLAFDALSAPCRSAAVAALEAFGSYLDDRRRTSAGCRRCSGSPRW